MERPSFLKVLALFVCFTAIPGMLLAQTRSAQADPLGDEEAAAVTGFLENPASNSFQSGIGVISGWVCEANQVVIAVNGLPQPVAYGTERPDTEAICGDADNGFGLLLNWNLLGDGEHEVVALVDGEELGRATVRVTTLGTEFVRSVAGECTVEDFPAPGQTVTLAWQQNNQNFALAGDSRSALVDDLKANAEAFEYTIGQYGGAMTEATIAEPLTLNLAIADDTGSSRVLNYLFEGLTESSWLTDEVEPGLAESWTRSEDGLRWIFVLRQDVTWHDGQPFTAHDVAFTFCHPATNPPALL